MGDAAEALKADRRRSGYGMGLSPRRLGPPKAGLAGMKDTRLVYVFIVNPVRSRLEDRHRLAHFVLGVVPPKAKLTAGKGDPAALAFQKLLPGQAGPEIFIRAKRAKK